jgi:thiol:disulfide interchange protein DsbD
LLENVRRIGTPVIVDFYAEWCTPCVELEQKTFHDSKIVSLSCNDFIMVKVDLTRSDNSLNEELLKRYNVKGVPTVVFIGPDGREKDDLRLVDFLPADQFLGRMAALTTKKPEVNHAQVAIFPERTQRQAVKALQADAPRAGTKI